MLAHSGPDQLIKQSSWFLNPAYQFGVSQSSPCTGVC